MRSKLLHDHAHQRTFALVFDIGDEVSSALLDFAQSHHVTAAHFTAIGAFSQATLAYFDWDTKSYHDIPVNEQVEVLVLAGDVSLDKHHPKVHAHCVLGRRDGSTLGGHLRRATVRPTLELILTESPAHLKRTVHDPSGLPLIDLR